MFNSDFGANKLFLRALGKFQKKNMYIVADRLLLNGFASQSHTLKRR